MGTRKYSAATTGSEFCIDSYRLLASSQHVEATAAVTTKPFVFMLLNYKQLNPLAHFSANQNSRTKILGL